jgi:hypothetical protein
MITLPDSEWERIKKKINEQYPPSVLLLRSKCKEELGFTVRQAKITNDTKWDYNKKGLIHTWHLDFFDEASETFFTMKYM